MQKIEDSTVLEQLKIEKDRYIIVSAHDQHAIAHASSSYGAVRRTLSTPSGVKGGVLGKAWSHTFAVCLATVELTLLFKFLPSVFNIKNEVATALKVGIDLFPCMPILSGQFNFLF